VDEGAPPAAGNAEEAGPNGFSFEKLIVSRESIRAGGPPRDGIRSVDSPEFVPPVDATWAPPPVVVIGLEHGGVAHAYPVHLLEYHQVVNDELAGTPVVLTYDPLTGVPQAYLRTVDAKVLEFGVSGLIYDAQFLLYDRQTESLWAQYQGLAIAGPMAGRRLEHLPVRQEPMGAWFQRHPGTLVLARPELKRIDYRHSPYEVYWTSDTVPFPVAARDDRYHPKEVVLGVEVDGKKRAYLGSILTAEGGRIVDELAGRKIRIAYDTYSGTFQWQVPPGVRVTEGYWFAWKSFHPETEIWHDLVDETPAP
jgi:hypothetical protein